MTELKDPAQQTSDRPPILDVLPPVLRRDFSPETCLCPHCAPGLTPAQRAAHERVQDDWRFTRIAWCDAHGYQFLDLIKAEGALPEGQVRPPR